MAVDDDDYELIPKHELENLRKEVEKLKKNPLGDLPEGETLVDEVKSLNSNIKKLIDLFASTESELAKEYSDSSPAQELRSVRDQNEQIAQGILALADMIKEMKDDSSSRQMAGQPQGMGQVPTDQFGLPTMPSDNFGLPDLGQPGALQQGPGPVPSPPPFPPAPEKKRGFFGR